MALEQIGLEAVLKDTNFQAGVKRYIAGLAQAEGKTKEATGGMSALGHTLSTAVGSAMGFLTAQAIPALIDGLKSIAGSALNTAMDYESSMNMFQAVSGATADQMAQVGKIAKELGADMTLPATSAGDAALAMTELAKSGLSVEQAMGAAKGTLQLAAAGNLSEAAAAEIASNALNAFKLSGDDATRVADLLAAAANASSGEVTDMADSLKMTAAVAAAAGIPIEDTVAAISEMANAGIKGSDAGTSLKQMLLSLEGPTDKARGLMRELGIDVYDSNGKMKPFRDIIGNIGGAMKGLTQEQRDAALATLFGSDAVRAANVVLLGGVDAFDKMRDAVTKQGAASELAGARMKGLRGTIEGIKSQLETAGLAIAEPLLAPLADVGKKIAEVVGSPEVMASLTAIGEVLGKNIAGGLDAVLKLISTLQKNNVGGIFKMLNLSPDVQKQINETFTMLSEKAGVVSKEVMPFINEQIAKFSAWWKENGPLISDYIKVIVRDTGNIAGTVLDMWNIVKPAFSSFIDIMLDLAKIFMQIRTGKWSEVWKSLGKLVSDAWEGIKKTALAFGNWVASWVGSSLDKIKKQWSDNWEMLKIIVGKTVENIKKAIGDWLDNIKQNITNKFNQVKDKAEEIWQSIGKAILKWIDKADQWVKETVNKTFDTVQSVWKFLFLSTDEKWKLIKEKIAEWIENARQAVVNKLEEVKTALSNAWDRIKERVTQAWTDITTAIKNFITGIPNAVNDAIQSIAEIGRRIVNSIKNGLITWWNDKDGPVQTLKGFLTGIVDYVWSGKLYEDISKLGANIIYAIRGGVSTVWNSATGVLSKLTELFKNIVNDLWTGELWDKIKENGSKIIEAIKQGIINHWNGFVEWLKGLIGGIFGGGEGSQGAPQGGFSAQAMRGAFSSQPTVTQYSSAVNTSNTWNVYINSLVPADTIAQDIYTVRSLAGV